MSNTQKPPERLPYSTANLQKALAQIGYSIAYRPGSSSFFRIYNQNGKPTYWEGNINGIRIDRKECFGEGGSGVACFEGGGDQEIDISHSPSGKPECVSIINKATYTGAFVSFYNHDA